MCIHLQICICKHSHALVNARDALVNARDALEVSLLKLQAQITKRNMLLMAVYTSIYIFIHICMCVCVYM